MGSESRESADVGLDYQAPIQARALIDFFARRAVPGVEEVVRGTYRRSVALPRGAGVVELREHDGLITAALHLDDPRDADAARHHCRALFDLDHDPQPVLGVLAGDPLIGQLVRGAPGRRVPGTVDPHELAVRAVLGQQVSLAGAATLAGRLVRDCGRPLARPVGSVTHLFPTAAAIAAVAPERLAMPASRKRALIGLTTALADRDVALAPAAAGSAPEAERERARAGLLALPGVGPWTVEYVAMRALRDPDAFMPTDLGVRHALGRLGVADRPAAAVSAAEPWRPYRAYALQYLWASLAS